MLYKINFKIGCYEVPGNTLTVSFDIFLLNESPTTNVRAHFHLIIFACIGLYTTHDGYKILPQKSRACA